MPLTSAALRQAIRPLFDQASMPSSDAVGAWCRVYAPYVRDVIAGPVTLSAPLTPGSGSGTFFDALDAALRTMWTSAAWVGPGVTAVTTLVPPLQPLLLALSPTLLASFDPEQAASLIAEALHTYTLSIVVTVTPASGTPFIANLT